MEYVKKRGNKYLSPFHHSLDTIQLVPTSVKQMKNFEKEKNDTRVWTPIPVIKEAISVNLSVHAPKRLFVKI